MEETLLAYLPGKKLLADLLPGCASFPGYFHLSGLVYGCHLPTP